MAVFLAILPLPLVAAAVGIGPNGMAVQLAIAELPLKAGAVGNGKNAVAIQAAVAELPLQAIARLAVFDPLLNTLALSETVLTYTGPRDPLIWLGAGVPHPAAGLCIGSPTRLVGPRQAV